MPILPDATRLDEIIRESLYKQEELGDGDAPPDGTLIGIGVMHRMGFHPERLEAHRAEVLTMIEALPIQFLIEADGGMGGWSFLNLCMNKDDQQWGEHPDCDNLIIVAGALGLCHFPMPDRKVWAALPGGMPYVVFRKEKREGDIAPLGVYGEKP